MARVLVVSGSSPRAIHSTPAGWKSQGRPASSNSDFHSSSDRIDQRV